MDEPPGVIFGLSIAVGLSEPHEHLSPGPVTSVTGLLLGKRRSNRTGSGNRIGRVRSTAKRTVTGATHRGDLVARARRHREDLGRAITYLTLEPPEGLIIPPVPALVVTV